MPFDPYANAQALLSGVNSGIAMAEGQRRAARDQAIMELEAEEAQFRRQQFQQQQAQAQAAQQFQAAEYESLIGRPTFDATVPGGANAVLTGEAFGTDAGMQGIRQGVQQVQQRAPLFAALPPALQQHYLEPMRKEADIRQRRQMVQDWAAEQFPVQPETRAAVMEDWDARNMLNLPESTIREIQDGRPLNPMRFRAQFDGLGLQPDQIDQLMAAATADRAGVPAGAVTQMFKPQFDPSQYRTELATAGIPDDAANKLHSIAIASGRRPPAGVVNAILGGKTLDEGSLMLMGYTPDEARGISQTFASSGKFVQPVVPQARADEFDRRQAATNAENDRRFERGNDEYDRRQQERARLRQMAPTSDANYIRLKGQVDAWQREIENQKTLNNKDGVRDAMANLYIAEDELDNYLRGAAGRAKPTPSPRGPGAPSGAPAPSSGSPVSMATRPKGWNDQRERVFQNWYSDIARQYRLDPNPDAPEHHYNYRMAYAAGKLPGADGHWPSEFKDATHPNRYVDGQDTITGEPAATTEARLTMRDALRRAQQELAPGGTQQEIQAKREQIKARAQQIMSGG